MSSELGPIKTLTGPMLICHFDPAFLYNKTWNIHKTTPFFNYDKHQRTQYEGELLTYIAANARNFVSSALTGPYQNGAAATIVNRTGGAFPGQIDSSGNNLVETLDEVGDIRGVTFQLLNMKDLQDSDEERVGEMVDNDSIVVTVTVRPKGNTELMSHHGFVRENEGYSLLYGLIILIFVYSPLGRTRDQPYYCVIAPDQRHHETSQTQGTSARHYNCNWMKPALSPIRKVTNITNKTYRPIAFTHFGVILFKAPVMIVQLVNQWLERRFDCRICHLVFQLFELRKIVESALEVSYNRPQGHG